MELKGLVLVKCVNKFCWCGTVRAFLALTPGDWLEQMTARYPRVAPFAVTPQQRRAWESSGAALRAALTEMGPTYSGIHIIFEYGLPKYPPRKNGGVAEGYAIYPDCILVARGQVVILEFKDRDLSDPDVAWKLSLRVRRYRNRIQKYHDQSWGFSKCGVLVSTVNTGLRRQTIKGVTLCSHDLLARELTTRLGPRPRPVQSIVRWRESAYSVHKPSS